MTPTFLDISPRVQVARSELDLSFSRSSGPGGQNVNKVNSKATLRWNARESPSLPEDIRARFLARFGARLTDAGEIVISSDRFRDQPRNIDDCLEKLRAMLLESCEPPRPRKPTRPTRGSQRRKAEAKRRHGETKRNRGRVRE